MNGMDIKMAGYYRFILPCLLLASMMTACSGDSEDKEAGAIDQLTDKVAREAVRNIRQPMEDVQQQMEAIQEARIKAVEEAAAEYQ